MDAISKSIAVNYRNVVAAVLIVLLVGAIGLLFLYDRASFSLFSDSSLSENGQGDNGAGGGAGLSYTAAVKAHEDRRIQFDEVCQAHPNQITYKVGTGLMLDNRTDMTLIIRSSLGATHTLSPYGFKIIDASVNDPPVELIYDCNDQQNVLTLLLQN